MGPPWRFVDRGWFVQDRINVLMPENLALVAAKLTQGNVVFGCHRWFAGGRSADLMAHATIEGWRAELDRGAPGDNLLAVSLRDVTDLASAVIGAPESPLSLGGSMGFEVIDDLWGARRDELTLLRRSIGPSGTVASVAFASDVPDEWDQQRIDLASLPGELHVFPNDIWWPDHERRTTTGEPPEEWTLSHGRLLVDGYLPDENGRVVCGGPY